MVASIQLKSLTSLKQGAYADSPLGRSLASATAGAVPEHF